ncbi:MAG: hypothetical protein AB1649_27600, partial [Chloroflexota bacterium]
AVLWHATIDGIAVYLGQQINIAVLEGIIAIFAVISLVIVFWLKRRFIHQEPLEAQTPAIETGTG